VSSVLSVVKAKAALRGEKKQDFSLWRSQAGMEI
jgi:hypothetical protein